MFRIWVFREEGCALTWMNSRCNSPPLLKRSVPVFRLVRDLNPVFLFLPSSSPAFFTFPQSFCLSSHLSWLGSRDQAQLVCSSQSPSLFTLLYKVTLYLSQALAMLILGDVNNCCLCFGHRVDSAVSVCVCVCVCVCVFVYLSMHQWSAVVKLKSITNDFSKHISSLNYLQQTWLLSFMLWRANDIEIPINVRVFWSAEEESNRCHWQRCTAQCSWISLLRGCVPEGYRGRLGCDIELMGT